MDWDEGPAQHVFVLRPHTDSDAQSVSVYRDGRAVLRRAPGGLAIAHLLWEVNRSVVEEAGIRLLLHAAAAEQDGKLVVLAGPEGSGKSTLVAALVSSGLRYMTDETVAIDPPTDTIAPYPKSIGLDRGSLESLRDVCHFVPPGLDTKSEQQLVPASEIRHGAVAHSNGVPRLLALLTYRSERATAARSIPRAEAAVALAQLSFNFRKFGRARLDAVAEVVRACDCSRLDMGDLDVARRLVLDLLGRATASS